MTELQGHWRAEVDRQQSTATNETEREAWARAGRERQHEESQHMVSGLAQHRGRILALAANRQEALSGLLDEIADKEAAYDRGEISRAQAFSVIDGFRARLAKLDRDIDSIDAQVLRLEKDEADPQAAVDRMFETFPVLAERRQTLLGRGRSLDILHAGVGRRGSPSNRWSPDAASFTRRSRG